MSWLRFVTLASGVLVACKFSAQLAPDAGPDGLPDAGVCAAASRECLGDTYRECTDKDATAIDTACAWGCLEFPLAHCAQLDPHGSAVVPDDLSSDGLITVELETGITIDGDTGRIGTGVAPSLVRAAGTGVIGGIDFQQRANNIAVFRFKSLRIKGSLFLTGVRAIALVSDGDIRVDGVIDARGACTPPNAGPGGQPGRVHDVAVAVVSGGLGASTDFDRDGGGGGGHAGTGGTGKGMHPGGMPFGDADITVLAGGGGGGGGGGAGGSGDGGGGGGALQLVSNGTIAIADVAGINAGGCGGETGLGDNDGGGGGGAGGTILLEAQVVKLDGALAVNGGGGGGGDANPDGDRADGQAGRLDQTPALGYDKLNAAGGNGGANTTFDGAPGVRNPTTDDGSGGGGAVGRIRINTRSGTPVLGPTAVLSPPANTAPTMFGMVRLR